MDSRSWSRRLWLPVFFFIVAIVSIAEASAAGAALPGRRSSFELSDYLRAEDCSKRKIQGREVTLCDLAKGYDRVMTACLAELDPSWAPLARAGCALTLAPGVYWQSRAFGADARESCHAHVLTGAGGASGQQLTRVYVAPGADGVHIGAWSRCRASKLVKSGGQHIRGIAFVALAGTATSASHGVYLEAPAIIEDVSAEGFTIGFRVDAGSKRKKGSEGNANGFALIRPWARSSEYAGIYVAGPDTNAGYVEQPTAIGSCASAERWEPRFANIPCAAIQDGSFLGNTWVAGHTASSAKRPGYRLGDSPTSRSVCVGCYGEINQPPSSLGANANAFGGVERWSAGPGLGWIVGARAGGLVLASTSGELRLGGHANGAFLELVTPRLLAEAPDMQNVTLSLDSDPKDKAFRFTLGHSGRASLAIRASSEDKRTMGRLTLLGPVCLGSSDCKAVVAEARAR